MDYNHSKEWTCKAVYCTHPHDGGTGLAMIGMYITNVPGLSNCTLLNTYCTIVIHGDYLIRTIVGVSTELTLLIMICWPT